VMADGWGGLFGDQGRLRGTFPSPYDCGRQQDREFAQCLPRQAACMLMTA